MRTYVDEGPIGVIKDGSSSVDQRYLFLFNDIVLLVKQVRKLSTKNPFQFVKSYEIKSNLIVQDMADTDGATKNGNQSTLINAIYRCRECI